MINCRNRHVYRGLVGRPEETGHSQYLGAERRITLKWVFKKQDAMTWSRFIRIIIGISGWLL